MSAWSLFYGAFPFYSSVAKKKHVEHEKKKTLALEGTDQGEWPGVHGERKIRSSS